MSFFHSRAHTAQLRVKDFADSCFWILLLLFLVFLAVANAGTTCRAPADIDNGYRSYSKSGGWNVGSVVTYWCQHGYSLHGEKYLTCVHSYRTGSVYWSHRFPVCVGEKDSSDSSKSRSESRSESSRSESSKSESSNSGSSKSGSSKSGSRKSGSSKSGSDSGSKSRSDSGSISKSCSHLYPPKNGKVKYYSTKPDSYAKYSCNLGCKLFGDTYRKCLHSGYWTGTTPVCKKNLCPNLDNPKNGKVTANGKSVGSEAWYTCNQGFKLKGSSFRKCLYNLEWDPEEPFCEAIDCGPPKKPANGWVINQKGTKVGASAWYYCWSRFVLVGSKERVCQPSGEWTPELPVCKPKDMECAKLKGPANGEVTLTGTTRGSLAKYRCDHGYKLEGLSTRVCEENGKWSSKAPVCKRVVVDCGKLESPENGSVDYSGTHLGAFAKYVCQTGYVIVGYNFRKCLLDGWSGEEPTCKPVDCGALESPQYGTVKYTDTTYKSEAHYSCRHGYTIWRGDKTRVCLAGGEWSGSAPFCITIDCGPLAPPDFGMVAITGTAVYAIATYRCIEGYELVGGAKRTCGSDRAWSGNTPTCKKKIVNCEALTNPENGKVMFESTAVGTIASYFCDSGYDLQGTSQRECLSSGMWYGDEPTCLAVMCPELQDQANGYVAFSSRTVGSQASYFCDPGYQLMGVLLRICEDSGKWSDSEPNCIPVECVVLKDPANGQVMLEGTSPGSKATFSCNEGFVLDKDVTLECGTNGEWLPDPPKCIAVSCVELSDPQNGVVTVASTDAGSNASYSCNTGYAISGGDESRECLSGGTWSGSEPNCSLVDCGPLQSPANGEVSFSNGTKLNSVAEYTCDITYELSGGDPQRTCQANGTWSGEAPQCNALECPELSPPENGKVEYESRRVSSAATYSCDEGYVLEGEGMTRFCLFSTEWSGEAPVCEPTGCDPLQAPANGDIVITGAAPNMLATYSCNEGYDLIGDKERRCLLDNKWEGAAPFCKLIDCGPLSKPSNGAVDVGETTFGSSASYTCDPGYEIVGTSSRTCDGNGRWSGDAPTCKSVDCGPLDSPPNGRVEFFRTTFPSIATYTCDLGYALSSSPQGEIRRCTETGQWSGTDPTCDPIDCGPLDSPVGGNVSVGNTTLGSLASYSCDEGLVLEGEGTRECREDGKWTGADPQCKVPAPSCEDPGVPLNGRRIGDNFTVGAVVFFQCFGGFDIVGSRFRVCREGGVYSGAQPTCQPVDDACFPNQVVDRCGRRCECVDGHFINCCRVRRDYVEVTTSERLAYIEAIKTIANNSTYRKRYDELNALYKASFDNGVSQSALPSRSQYLMFLRYFLLEYEDLLREIDCRITVPYWDWTPFPDHPYTAEVFDNEQGFGDTSRPEDKCVVTGPFHEVAYQVSPSAGGGCLKREYSDRRYPSRDMINRDLLTITADDFILFHQNLQLFIGGNVQCSVGGTMCSSDASNDPLFLLHASQLDFIFTRWQSFGEGRDTVRYSSDTSPLLLSPGYSVVDFSDNTKLPNGVCVMYDPPAFKNHPPPPTAAATLAVTIEPMGCVPMDMLDFMEMSPENEAFMDEMCKKDRVFRSVRKR